MVPFSTSTCQYPIPRLSSMSFNQRACLLMVDDDPEDILSVKIAAKRADIPLVIRSLADGKALMEHLASLDRTQVIDGVVPDLLVFEKRRPQLFARIQIQPALPGYTRYRLFNVGLTGRYPTKLWTGRQLYICKPGGSGATGSHARDHLSILVQGSRAISLWVYLMNKRRIKVLVVDGQGGAV